MNIISLIYNKLLQILITTSGYRLLATRAMLEVFIRSITLITDPEVQIKLGGRYLHMPLSHRLPIYMAGNLYYDELPIRLSTFLREKYGYLSLIDVGANIGDTISACVGSKDDKFLAIEANPSFGVYLKKNCRELKQCRLLEVFCGASDGKSEVRIVDKMGTATIAEHDGGHKIDRKALDTIIDENPEYCQFNFLKIDTDGHDFEVIQGAQRWISKNLPAVLFECDVFGNENYVEDVVKALGYFAQAGYSKALVYDNFGYLFKSLELDSIDDFKWALMYQLISKFHYFDILVIQDEDAIPFLESEIAYFIDEMPDKSLQQTAKSTTRLAL